MSELLDLAVQAVRKAGAVVLTAYRKKLDIEIKGDGSPLTIGDQKAHQTILERLAATKIAIVSKEGDDLN